MATYTGNLNLKKPSLDDDALITDINNNMDILDTAANGIQDALAIVANGDTHVAITAGQYVYVRKHNTLAEGLYVASSNIAANAALSSSNLTADSKGGMNAISEKIGTVPSGQTVEGQISSLSEQIGTIRTKMAAVAHIGWGNKLEFTSNQSTGHALVIFGVSNVTLATYWDNTSTVNLTNIIGTHNISSSSHDLQTGKITLNFSGSNTITGFYTP